MILTCPECATGYFVDDAQMRPGGRLVKCANCGARWTALPESPLELTPAPAGEAAAEGDATEAPLLVRPGDELPKAIRARISTKRQVRQLAVSGMIWGGVAAALAALVGAAVILRVDVVKAWPRTASAYAAVGLRVNAVGLVIENQSAEPSLQDGHAALSVSGMIRNVEDHAIVSPPLRMTLLNKEGKRVGAYIRRPANPRIPAGGALYFATAIMDPPSSAHDLEITFAPDLTGVTALTRPIGRPTAAVMTPGLKGPASPEPTAAASVVQDATPLAGTPNALPAQAATPDPATPASAPPASHE